MASFWSNEANPFLSRGDPATFFAIIAQDNTTKLKELQRGKVMEKLWGSAWYI